MSDGCKPLLLELEEKVKECGRLVLRMGGDVMEGAKRRQALEEETHELRMRLASVEALHTVRSPQIAPVTSKGLLPSVVQSPLIDADSNLIDLNPAVIGTIGAWDDRDFGLCSSDDTGTGNRLSDALQSGGHWTSSGCAASFGLDFGASVTWPSNRESAVDGKLCSLPEPDGSSPSQNTSIAGKPSVCNELPSNATALKMTREELDARVQRILGKHGQLSNRGRK